jgi:hypothetical protein
MLRCTNYGISGRQVFYCTLYDDLRETMFEKMQQQKTELILFLKLGRRDKISCIAEMFLFCFSIVLISVGMQLGM